MSSCRYYQAGNCRYGTTCRNKHVNMSDEASRKYRTVVCSFYTNGHCRNGDGCTFLHQAENLTTAAKSEENTRNWKQCENLITEQRNAWIENNYSKWRIESERDNLSDKFRFSVPSPTSEGDCIFYSSDSDMEWDQFDSRQISRLQSTTLALAYCSDCKMDFLSGETGRAVCVYCGVPQPQIGPSFALQPDKKDLFTELNLASLAPNRPPGFPSKIEPEVHSTVDTKLHEILKPVPLTAINQAVCKTGETTMRTSEEPSICTTLEEQNMPTVERIVAPVVRTAVEPTLMRTAECTAVEPPVLTDVQPVLNLLAEPIVDQEDAMSSLETIPPELIKMSYSATNLHGEGASAMKSSEGIHFPQTTETYGIRQGKKKKRRKTRTKIISEKNVAPGNELPEKDLGNLDDIDEENDFDLNVDYTNQGLRAKERKRKRKKPSNSSKSSENKCDHKDESCSERSVYLYKILELFANISYSLLTLLLILLCWVLVLILRLAWKLAQLAAGMAMLLIKFTFFLISRAVNQFDCLQRSVEMVFCLVSAVCLMYAKVESFAIDVAHQRHRKLIPCITLAKSVTKRERSHEGHESLFSKVKGILEFDSHDVVESDITAVINQNPRNLDSLYALRAFVRSCDNQNINALKDLASIKSFIISDVILLAKCYMSLGLVDNANQALNVLKKDGNWNEIPEIRVIQQLSMSHRDAMIRGRLNNQDSTFVQTNFPSFYVVLLAELVLKTSDEKLFEILTSLSICDSIEEPVKNYIKAVNYLHADKLYEAELGFKLCARQNFKQEKCTELGNACLHFRYHFNRAFSALQLGLLVPAHEIFHTFASLCHVSSFLFTKVKLLEAEIYLFYDLNAAKKICDSFDKRYSVLRPSFLLLRAKILIAEHEYQKALLILPSLTNDPKVGMEAIFLKSNLKEELKVESQKTHYDVLGVDFNATQQEICAAYDNLVSESHSLSQGKVAMHETQLKEYSAAYQILKDENKRRKYDKSLKHYCDGRLEAKHLCQEELGDVLRKWWSKRHGKMRLVATPTADQVERFLQTYTREKHVHLVAKYRLDSVMLREVVEDLCNKSIFTKYL